MKQADNDARVFYGIKEIKEIAFSVDESIEFESGSGFTCHYTVNIASVVIEETVAITIEATFKEKKSDQIFMSGKSLTKFTIQNMKKYARFNNDGIEVVDLPDPLWVTFFSLAYSHARAFLAKSSGGTKFTYIFLPLINPEEEFRRIFAADLAKQN
jgi:hypothetical protein